MYYTPSFPVIVTDNDIIMAQMGGAGAVYSEDYNDTIQSGVLTKEQLVPGVGCIVLHQELLTKLSTEHANAIIAHEEGHLLHAQEQYPVFKQVFDELKTTGNLYKFSIETLEIEKQADAHAAKLFGVATVIAALDALQRVMMNHSMSFLSTKLHDLMISENQALQARFEALRNL